MFEAILGSAKFLTDEKTLNAVHRVISALKKGEPWKDESLTVKASFPKTEKESLDLLRDFVADKMEVLEYGTDAISSFGFCFGEIVQNRIRHVTPKDKDIVIAADANQTFVSVRVFNPQSCQVYLGSWIQKAKEQIYFGQASGGRGLYLVEQHADVLEQEGDFTVKFMIYRERVSISKTVVDGVTVYRPLSGFANPSLAVRMKNEVKECEGATKYILVVPDPKGQIAITPKRKFSHSSSQAMGLWHSHIVDQSEGTARLVIEDDVARRAFPSPFVFGSVAEAVDDINSGRRPEPSWI